MKNHDILDGHKAKIELLNEKKTNYLEKIRFLESKHHSLLKRNHVLTQEIEKIKSSSSIMKIFTLELKFSIKFLINSKPSVIREVWRILTRLKLLLVEILFFVKGKEENPRQATPSNTHSLCTHCKKFRHTHHRCYTKFHERYESQLNRLVNEFNSLKNNILNNGKMKKNNQKSKTQQCSSKPPPKVK